METRSLFTILALTILTSFNIQAQTATAPAGSGSEGDPFLIASLDNLYWLSQADTVWEEGYYYEQTADIDASDTENWDSGAGFTPIAPYYGSGGFTGFYDGGGHTISNLYINRPTLDGVGMFGRTTDDAVIKNLNLLNVDVTGDGVVGAITGRSNGLIEKVSVVGSVAGTYEVGGLAGMSKDIYQSYSNIALSAQDDEAGGLTGYFNGDSLKNSYARGSVSGEGSVGGIAGSMSSSVKLIENVYFSGGISSVNPEYVGPIQGYDEIPTDTVNVYYNTIFENNTNGFGSGLNLDEMRQQASFSGFDFSNIWQIDEGTSYPYLRAVPENPAPGSILTQVFPGDNSEGVKRKPLLKWVSTSNALSYDIQVSTNENFSSTTINETGVSGSEYQVATDLAVNTTYYWRVRSVTSEGDQAWVSGFSFKTTPFQNGAGTEANPYQVSTVDQVDGIRLEMDAHFKLVNDIDVSFATGDSAGAFWNNGAGFEPIGTDESPFLGSIDGDGFAIIGLYMNSDSDHTSLIAELNENATIKNLGLTHINITLGSRSGAFVGNNYGTINNCYATGEIDGTDNFYIGGMIGVNFTEGTLSNSYSEVKISARSSTGGLVGANRGTVSNNFANGDVSVTGNRAGGLVALMARDEATISNSYATGNISGGDDIGGLVGYHNYGTITNSYATGTISGTGDGIGGLIGGTYDGDIRDSYASGKVTGGTNVGGVIGIGSSRFTARYSYYNSDSVSSNSYGTGLTTSQMKQQSSFSGFDFSSDWSIKEPLSFPYLQELEPDTLPGGYPVLTVKGNAVSFSSGAVTIPNANSYDNLSEITIEAWIYPESSERMGILEKHNSPSSGFWIDLNDDITAILVTEEGERYASTGSDPELNAWHHVAIVYDGQDITMYLNGINTTSGSGGSGSGNITSNTREIIIGALNWTSANFDGLIDELRIWNDIRTPEEIRQNMYQQLNGDETGLISYLPFDESNTNIALNKANETNYGTLGSGVSRVEDTHPYGTFITGTEGWRVMSSPFENVSYGTMLDTLWTQGFTGSDSPDYGSSNVYYYDEANSQFASISGAEDIPDKGTGFITYVYNDQNFDSTDDGFPKVIELDSSQVSGLVDPSLSFTDSGTLADDGWNLLGNPYGASIDWDANAGWTTENLDASIYVWSDSANGGEGDYLTWNGSTGSLQNGIIAPWQGFWVKANAADPEIAFNDDIRSAGGIFLKEQPTPQLRFTINDGEMSNEAIVMFDEESTIGKDRLDAYKLSSLSNNYLLLFTQSKEGSALDINALPNNFNESIAVPLGFDGSDLNGEFELSWNIEALPEDWSLTLKDHTTGEEIDLKEQAKISLTLQQTESNKNAKTQSLASPLHGVLSPQVMKTKNSSTPRFTLTITSAEAVTNERLADIPNQVELRQNYPNPFNPTTNIEYGVPETGIVTMEVFDLLGRKVATLINRQTQQAGRYSIQFDAGNLASGLYLYRLQAGNTVITKKLTLIK